MNKREADWLDEALTTLRSDIPAQEKVDAAEYAIEQALKVRTILPVCQICLKIGGCDHQQQ